MKKSDSKQLLLPTTSFLLGQIPSKPSLYLQLIVLSFYVILLPNAYSQSTALAIDKEQHPLKPFYVEYIVGNNLLNAGTAKLSLKMQVDNQWIYSLKTEPSGIFRLTGKGRIHEVSIVSKNKQQYVPRSYFYKHGEDNKRRNIDAQFNWQDQELTIMRKGEEEVEHLTDPILDRLSVTLAVMDKVRKGFDQAEILVLDNGSVKNMQFINEGTALLKTKLGTFNTVIVRRIREGSSRETITWFAQELNYIPVQIEQLKRGKLVARMKINKFKELVVP